MKKAIFTSTLLFLFMLNSIAQQKDFNPEKMIDKQLEEVQEKLKLDNIELLMVKEVVLKYHAEKIALREKEMPDGEKRIQVQEINLKQEKELSQFLNEDQLVEFKKIMKTRKKEIRKDRPRKGSGTKRGRRNSF